MILVINFNILKNIKCDFFFKVASRYIKKHYIYFQKLKINIKNDKNTIE
jgi:hypothetical protein